VQPLAFYYYYYYYYGEEIGEVYMGRECDRIMREVTETYVQGFGGKTCRK
jgi:hypothetical protein